MTATVTDVDAIAAMSHREAMALAEVEADRLLDVWTSSATRTGRARPTAKAGTLARLQYLADMSVFARLSKPNFAAAFAPLAAEGRVGLCAPVAFELGFSARNHGDYIALTERLVAFPTVPVTDADQRRSLEVQAALSARGQHRALSLVDALVAAAAEVRGLTILHYDADFELVAEITSQQHEWIVERGTAD